MKKELGFLRGVVVGVLFSAFALLLSVQRRTLLVGGEDAFRAEVLEISTDTGLSSREYLASSVLAHVGPGGRFVAANVLMSPDVVKNLERSSCHTRLSRLSTSCSLDEVPCMFVDAKGRELEGNTSITLLPDETMGMNPSQQNMTKSGRIFWKSEAIGTKDEDENRKIHGLFRSYEIMCSLTEEIPREDTPGEMRVLFGKNAARTHVSSLIFRTPRWPSQPSMHTNKPIACARAIFGPFDARIMVKFVNHMIFHGVSTVIFYETGLSQIENRYLLDDLIKSGKLTLVDLRNAFQDVYGIGSSFVALRSKAGAQILLRGECHLRVQAVNPSWVLFFDYDEFIVPGPQRKVSETLKTFLDLEVPMNVSAVRFNMVEDPSESYCKLSRNGSNFEPVEFANFSNSIRLDVLEGKVKLKTTYLTKFAVRPSLDRAVMFVHNFDREKLAVLHPDSSQASVSKLKDFYLAHERCVNKIEAFDPRVPRSIDFVASLARRKWWVLPPIHELDEALKNKTNVSASSQPSNKTSLSESSISLIKE